jgi:hypothetical protein
VADAPWFVVKDLTSQEQSLVYEVNKDGSRANPHKNRRMGVTHPSLGLAHGKGKSDARVFPSQERLEPDQWSCPA